MGDTSHLTLLNEAFFYDSTGTRLGTYVKKNLWHPERYVPGVTMGDADISGNT